MFYMNTRGPPCTKLGAVRIPRLSLASPALQPYMKLPASDALRCSQLRHCSRTQDWLLPWAARTQSPSTRACCVRSLAFSSFSGRFGYDGLWFYMYRWKHEKNHDPHFEITVILITLCQARLLQMNGIQIQDLSIRLNNCKSRWVTIDHVNMITYKFL